MNEKKAKRLRRSIMTHDEWLEAKRNRKYILTDFDGPPRVGNKVIFVTQDNQIGFGEVSKKLPDHIYEVKTETSTYTVGLGAMKPRRAGVSLDKISQYKEAKKHVKSFS